MVTQTIVVTEISGLHLRPAGKISEVSLQFQSKILIKKENQIANAKSVLGLLAARVQQGDEIEIVCDGSDEEVALPAIVRAIQEGFEPLPQKDSKDS